MERISGDLMNKYLVIYADNQNSNETSSIMVNSKNEFQTIDFYKDVAFQISQEKIDNTKVFYDEKISLSYKIIEVVPQEI